MNAAPSSLVLSLDPRWVIAAIPPAIRAAKMPPAAALATEI